MTAPTGRPVVVEDGSGGQDVLLAGLDEPARQEAWAEVGAALGQFEGPAGFTGPCQLFVAAATR